MLNIPLIRSIRGLNEEPDHHRHHHHHHQGAWEQLPVAVREEGTPVIKTANDQLIAGFAASYLSRRLLVAVICSSAAIFLCFTLSGPGTASRDISYFVSRLYSAHTGAVLQITSQECLYCISNSIHTF